MKKIHYQKELLLLNTQKRGGQNTAKEVMKLQSWLCLYEMAHPGTGTLTAIDGDFGPATENAVKNFQQVKGLPASGIVDALLFDILCKPLKDAFEANLTGTTIRELIVEVAHKHLTQLPMELMIKNQTNSGPWVRSYMDNNEGKDWLWCMGFVQTIIDQAFSAMGKDFRAMMPITYSCDTVGTLGSQNNALIRNSSYKDSPQIIKKGDIFLLRKSKFDWIHTGIIVEIGAETFETIEGNTNSDGSSNGNGVYKRIRNFKKGVIDVFSIENWI